jgi:hypothetical protein
MNPQTQDTIALRAHAAPKDWQPTAKRRSKAPSPETAFLLLTVPRDAPGEPLHFGVCAVLVSTRPPARPLCLRLFYADDATRQERALLARAAKRHGLAAPIPRSELLKLLHKYGYQRRAAMVGFQLPVDLGRLAADWSETDDGGFRLILWTKPCPPGRRSKAERRRRPKLQNGEIENGDRPAVAVNPIDGLRTYIAFQGRGRPDPHDLMPEGDGGHTDERYVFPGHFVDLATLATSLTGKRITTLDQATINLALPPPPPTVQGKLGFESVDAALARLHALADLYATLLACHQITSGSDRCPPSQVFSQASYAEAILEQAGLGLPLQTWTTLPRSLLGIGMGALYGGDCGLAERHVLNLPVDYYDVTGEYPVCAHLVGAFDLLRHNAIDIIEEDPEELTAFLAELTVERLLSEPELWRRLGRTICHIIPRGDLLPHRVPNGKAWLLKVAPINHPHPIPYLLLDLASSYLDTGQLPEIVSAVSLQPVRRRRRRLRALELPSGRVFDPRTDDLFLCLAEERLLVEQRTDLPEHERARCARVLKLIVNAACFGLLCQVNIHPANKRTLVELVNSDGNEKLIRPEDVFEEPGRWYVPPVAAAVTASGRLMLRLIRLLVEQAGGTVVYWDTDSVCVTGLTDQQMLAIRRKLEQLSPYTPQLRASEGEPLLLALEPENHHPETGERRQLYFDGTASKSYQLYALQVTADGELIGVETAKVSEHGLGHLQPSDLNWIAEGKTHLLHQALGLATGEPVWWEQPARSVITLTRPGELRRLERNFRTSKGTSLRPFSRLAVLHPVPHYARREDGTRKTPVAPYHESFDWRTATWRDLTTGEPLHPRLPSSRLTEADLHHEPGRVLIETLGSTLERNRARRDPKTLDQQGAPCGPSTTGQLQPAPTNSYKEALIGKEARNLDRVGVTDDPTTTIYNTPEDDTWETLHLPVLRRLVPAVPGGQASIARRANIARPTLNRILKTGKASRRVKARLAEITGELAADALHALGQPAPPTTDECCHEYLTVAGSRPRACVECGTPLSGRQTQWCSDACRKKASRVA